MSDESKEIGEILFIVQTPLGFVVRVSKHYWELIVSVKHPVMAGHENDVKETLRNPDEVRLSKNDARVYLFYREERLGQPDQTRRWLRVE